METRLRNLTVKKVERVEPATIPPGRYPAMWSGYQVALTNQPYVISTKEGCRGFFALTVVVTSNEIYFERSV